MSELERTRARLLGAANGTDQRLDVIIAQNDRMIEQIGQLIDLGIEAVAAIKDSVPTLILEPEVEQRPTTAVAPENVTLQEPARRRVRKT
jgi:hypothetical protein